MPISKINHSIIFVPSFNPESEEGKIFIVGGEDKKAFYYDLKKNYFIKWESTNELHTKPALLLIGEYLYLFDSLQQENYCFERTKLTDNKSKWEKIVPNFDENIKVNFPSQTFAVSLEDLAYDEKTKGEVKKVLEDINKTVSDESLQEMMQKSMQTYMVVKERTGVLFQSLRGRAADYMMR